MVGFTIHILRLYSGELFSSVVSDFLSKHLLKHRIAFKASVFVNSEDNNNYFSIINILNQEFDILCIKIGIEKPCISFISQKPLDENEIIIEFYFAESNKANKFCFKQIQNVRYCVIENDAYKSVITSQVLPLQKQNTYSILHLLKHIDYSFSIIQLILLTEGMTLSNIVRQWAFIENVLNLEEFDGGLKQYYQLYSDIRTRYFNQYYFTNGFPAATGISQECGLFSLDVIAMEAKEGNSISIVPITNPKQVNAYEYSQSILVGSPLRPFTHKTTPKFERGKVVRSNQKSVFYISGTSSVIGENSVFIGDIVKQTEQSVNNIKLIIEKQNEIATNESDCFSILDFNPVRVYLNDPATKDVVKTILMKYFPAKEIYFLKCKICRIDLLLEIETTATKNISM